MEVPPASDAPGDPVGARIPARSRQQALDWSLVLASQGLEPVIDFSEEDGGWALWVPSQDCDRAVECIRLYEHENRGWPWQKELLFPGVLFDWASLAWTLLICLFFWVSDSTGALRSAGMMSSIEVSNGQWWRLFTAVWLHADLAHLAANATIGIVLLGLAMGRYGTGTGLLAAYLAGAGGNLFAWFFAATPHNSLGASGMVMGCLGLIAVQSLLALQTSSTQPK